MHVLLIEGDSLAQTESLRPWFQEQGHETWLVHSPEDAAQKTELLWPNLIVLNSVDQPLDLPSFEHALNQIELNIPCIIINPHSQFTPKKDSAIHLSQAEPQQLSQSIGEAVAQEKDRFLRIADLVLDRQRHQVLRAGKKFSLTPKEFKLLRLLMENPNQVLSRKQIMLEVWETDYLGDTRTLDVHIRWLREKIEAQPSQPTHLLTVRGVGYHFVVKPNSA